MRPLLALGLLALALAGLGCDDAAPTPAADQAPAADAGPSDAGRADQGPPPDAAPPADAAPARPAFIELSLEPRQPVYTRADTPRVNARIYDRVGAELPRDGVDLRLDVQPASQGSVGADGVLRFTAEGQGAVRACVRGTNLCGRASFFVDDGPPPLEVLRPARGAVVEGEAAVIVVEGQTAPGVSVFVNDLPTPVDPDGRFRAERPAVFGYNLVDVVADDGVHRPPPRVVREVIYAPALLPVGPEGVALADAVRLRLDQALFDQDGRTPQADEAGVVRPRDLAGLVEAFLSRLALTPLVPDPVADGGGLQLRIRAISPGTPDCALRFTATGLELFLRLEGLRLEPEGSLELEGERFDLGGSLRLTAAAVAELALEAGPDGAPRLRLVTVDVALERLDGALNDSTAQALLDTLGSLLRSVLEGVARDLVRQVAAEAVPALLELSLGDALEPLRAIPLDVEAAPPLPALALDLGFELSAPSIVPRRGMELGLSGFVRPRTPTAPPYPVAGVPRAAPGGDPPWPAAGALAVAVRLSAVNALAFTVWQQGALELDLTAVVPEALRAVIREARTSGRLPPLVVGTPPGSPDLFELQIGELDLYLRGPRSGPEPDHYTLSLRAGLRLEVGGGGLRFAIAEAADLRVALLSSSGPRPAFEAELLEQLLEPIIWGEIRESVGEGLELALDPIVIGADAWADFAPSVAAIELGLDFPVAPRVAGDWFVLPAGIALSLR